MTATKDEWIKEVMKMTKQDMATFAYDLLEEKLLLEKALRPFADNVNKGTQITLSHINHAARAYAEVTDQSDPNHAELPY